MFFGEIIAILLDACLEFLIAGQLELVAPMFTTSGEQIAYYMAFVCLGFILVVL